jgi:hypothetical protein
MARIRAAPTDVSALDQEALQSLVDDGLAEVVATQARLPRE